MPAPLPVAIRSLIIQRRREKKSYGQIATEFGISRATVQYVAKNADSNGDTSEPAKCTPELLEFLSEKLKEDKTAASTDLFEQARAAGITGGSKKIVQRLVKTMKLELSVASGSEGVLAANEEQNLPVNPGVPEPIEEEEEEEVTEDEEVIDEPDMPKSLRRRRSHRQSIAAIRKAQEQDRTEQLERVQSHQNSSNFFITSQSISGRGVRTTRNFDRGDLLLIYPGQLFGGRFGGSVNQIKSDLDDERFPSTWYPFFFKFEERQHCIIGKTESDDLAVFVNHATERKEGKSILNVVTKVMVINGRPNIVLVASRAIKKGAELAYYYGEKRRSVLNESQWMK